GLAGLITERIGSGWIDDTLLHIKKLAQFADDTATLDELWRIKQRNKEKLALVIGEKAGTYVSPNSMFIAQIKRLHEYKRQLLACLGVVAQYLELRRNPDMQFTPRTYVFAGKAAAGYAMAKLHIKLINSVADVINFDPEVRGRIKVTFVPNYGVSLAAVIIPATDVSVQISLAGKEASGTGNMKFAMNGALTLGTLDGANVEIREEVGPENFYLFGLTADQAKETRENGYDPSHYIERSARLKEVVEVIESGFFNPGQPGLFKPITDSLRYHDPYMVCADFDAYMATEHQAAMDYRDPRAWSRRALLNIAGSGKFSSDETIAQYSDEIWHLNTIHVNLDEFNS